MRLYFQNIHTKWCQAIVGSVEEVLPCECSFPVPENCVTTVARYGFTFIASKNSETGYVFVSPFSVYVISEMPACKKVFRYTDCVLYSFETRKVNAVLFWFKMISMCGALASAHLMISSASSGDKACAKEYCDSTVPEEVFLKAVVLDADAVR